MSDKKQSAKAYMYWRKEGDTVEWKITPDAQHAGNWRIVSGGRCIAKVYSDDARRDVHTNERAALIAAAPDLLEALRVVTNTLVYLKGDGWNIIERARAAIAKASGECECKSPDWCGENRTCAKWEEQPDSVERAMEAVFKP